MSDAAILAALARLEAGQEALAGRMDRLQVDVRDRFDRLDSKMDKMAAEVSHLGPRVSALESDFAGHYVRAATTNNRLDELDVRLSLIERRLEVRDQPPPV